MKTKLPLEKGWCLRSLEPATSVDPPPSRRRTPGRGLVWTPFPAEVHDILLAHGKLDPEYRLGWCESAAWVTKLDWLYRLDFDCETPGVRTYLRFGGLDTFADIYLNGVLIGTHNDFYVSDLIDVSGTVAVHNTLLLHFHNALGVLDELEQPEKWAHLDKCKLLRKSRHDFPADITEGSTYQGIVGYHTPVGIYETVELILADAAEITCDEIRAALREDPSPARFVSGWTAPAIARERSVSKCCSTTPKERRSAKQPAAPGARELTIPCNGAATLVARRLRRAPALPRRGRGHARRPPLRPCNKRYRLPLYRAALFHGLPDQRKTRPPLGRFHGPFQAHTYVWQHERAWRILDMAENAHVNILRIWGEGGVPFTVTSSMTNATGAASSSGRSFSTATACSRTPRNTGSSTAARGAS